MSYKPIFKSPDQINEIAEYFLSNYHSSSSLPVPIEEIIEFQLGIDIIPVPGLRDCFENMGLDIDAFISSDFKSITVDSYMQEHRENRYRFTLAHEIGHMLLHKDIYAHFKFSSIEDWLRAIKEMPLKEREMGEWQSNEFAGLILVPRSILKDKFEQAMNRARESFSAHNKDFLLYVAIKNYLSPLFCVSEEVLRIRLQNDNLITWKDRFLNRGEG